jgi:hypothetical protein
VPSGTNSRGFLAPVNAGHASSSAQIFLAADAGATDEDIAISVGFPGPIEPHAGFALGNLEAALASDRP